MGGFVINNRKRFVLFGRGGRGCVLFLGCFFFGGSGFTPDLYIFFLCSLSGRHTFGEVYAPCFSLRAR